MTVIHIKATEDNDKEVISELMNVLIKNGFKTEKYLGICSIIVMARLNKIKESLK